MNQGYRDESHTIPGFNLAVIDIDEGTNIDTFKLLMKDYKYLAYTTKRHTEDKHRFRVIFPLSHILKLNPGDYKEFMNNIYEWLPIKVDEQTCNRSRKWLSATTNYWYNEGKLLDALLFIPKTKKQEENKKFLTDTASLNNMERWMLANANTNGRNNTLLRYGTLLVDSGLSKSTIEARILSLNEKLPDKLSEEEIMSTIFVTVHKKLNERSEDINE